jgi:hypothetical protein
MGQRVLLSGRVEGRHGAPDKIGATGTMPIHRTTSRKRLSRKSMSRILHSPGPIEPETTDSPGRVPNPKPYTVVALNKDVAA